MAVRHWALWRKGTHGGQKDMTSTLMFTHGRRRGKSKNVCSAWANRKLSLIATMAFLEFRLSGFETASKPRAQESPGFLQRSRCPRKSHDCWSGPMLARSGQKGPISASGVHRAHGPAMAHWIPRVRWGPAARGCTQGRCNRRSAIETSWLRTTQPQAPLSGPLSCTQQRPRLPRP
jgi:hypothetical protein